MIFAVRCPTALCPNNSSVSLLHPAVIYQSGCLNMVPRSVIGQLNSILWRSQKDLQFHPINFKDLTLIFSKHVDYKMCGQMFLL